MRYASFLFLFCAVTLSLSRAATVEPPLDQPNAERDARAAWHKEARFGGFIHWGVYADLGGEYPGATPGTYSEHVMRWAKIPRAVYLEKVAKPFNPSRFDADTWVKLFRETGMRYLIVTAKHHDGYAMYPSKYSEFDIGDASSFRRDPMRELREACRKHGLKFGFYYSHAFDWEHPDAPGNDWDYNNPGGDKNRDDPDWWTGRRPDFVPRARKYVDEKSIPQIQELIKNYQPDLMWFDTPHKLPPEENRRILQAVRDADPNVVVNGRLLRGYGDYKNTADRPAEIAYTSGHWEGIPTTNESYGWSRIDHSHKPPGHFIQLLAKSVSKGGNMLLNIGPMGTGEIDPKDVAIFNGIGAWMAKFGESIWGCERTPLPVQNWGTSTLKGNRLYLHVFKWPAKGKLLVSGLRTDPTSARLLARDAAPLAWRRVSPDDIELKVPAEATDPADTVVALDFGTKPEAKFARYIGRDEITMLHVMDGGLAGGGIRYGDGKRNNDCTLGWARTDSGVDWPVRVPVAGRYLVSLNYASPAVVAQRVTAAQETAEAAEKSERAASAATTSEYRISIGDRSLTGTVEKTKSPTTFATFAVGEIQIPAGEAVLSIRPTQIAGGELMKLRTIELTPLP